MTKSVDIHALEELATPVVAGLGYELVDLEWKHEAGHWTLRVFIDKPDGDPSKPGTSVGLEDCARVSHSLSAEIDVAEAIHVPFHLEVSSPGLDRPLKREADFRRFAGQRAKVRTRSPHTAPHAGAEPATPRRNFAGRLVGCDEGRIRIDVDGHTWEIPVSDVEKANLIYEFGQGHAP